MGVTFKALKSREAHLSLLEDCWGRIWVAHPAPSDGGQDTTIVNYRRRKVKRDSPAKAAAILTQEGKQRLQGIHRLHSLAVDPHKWLYQPMMAGCAIVREFEHLREAFRILPPYLQDKERGAAGVDFCDYGVELSRNFRALKLWMSLKTHGVEAFRAAMEYNLRLAQLAEHELRRLPNWRIVSPATMGILAFRYEPPHLAPEQIDSINRALVDAMIEDGYAVVSSTVLRGRVALRMCMLNPRATEADVQETVRRLHAFAERLCRD